MQDKNLNILRTKKAFKVKQNPFFIIFKEFSVAKTCFKPDNAPLKNMVVWDKTFFFLTFLKRS